MNEDQIIQTFSNFLNNLPAEKRTAAIEQLFAQTNFCWECGYVEDKDYPCQCWNDE